MKKMYKKYGTLKAQGEVYALLRPLPFEPEHTIPGTDAYFVAYALDFSFQKDHELFQYTNPHVVYVKGSYVLDMRPGDRSEDIAVYVEEKEEGHPLTYTVTLKDLENALT